MFIGICSVDDVPDARTIWKYREELTRCGAYDELFKQFYTHLQSLGLIVNEGKIIDASFVVSPRQRNTREENKAIKIISIFLENIFINQKIVTLKQPIPKKTVTHNTHLQSTKNRQKDCTTKIFYVILQ